MFFSTTNFTNFTNCSYKHNYEELHQFLKLQSIFFVKLENKSDIKN